MTTEQKKKSNAVRNTVLGAIVAIVVALASSPGFFAWLEGAGSKADVAGEKARESLQKTEIAYQLLKQQVEFMGKQIDQSAEDMRDLRNTISMMRAMSDAGVRTGHGGGGRVPAAVGGAAVVKAPPAPVTQAETVPQLPGSLEEAWQMKKAE